MIEERTGRTAGWPRVHAESPTTLTRMLLICGIIAGPLFMTVAVIQTLTRDGFDLGRQPISLLSLGESGWIQRGNFVISGLLVIAFAVGIRRVLSRGRVGTWAAWLVVAYGLGLILAGVYTPDASMGFPPGAPEGNPETLSRHAVLHGIGFMLAWAPTAWRA